MDGRFGPQLTEQSEKWVPADCPYQSSAEFIAAASGQDTHIPNGKAVWVPTPAPEERIPVHRAKLRAERIRNSMLPTYVLTYRN